MPGEPRSEVGCVYALPGSESTCSAGTLSRGSRVSMIGKVNKKGDEKMKRRLFANQMARVSDFNECRHGEVGEVKSNRKGRVVINFNDGTESFSEDQLVYQDERFVPLQGQKHMFLDQYENRLSLRAMLDLVTGQ